VSLRSTIQPKIILTVESLNALVQGMPGGNEHPTRYPALERLLGRAHWQVTASSDMDRYRFALFGQVAGNALPLAAVRRLADLSEDDIPEHLAQQALQDRRYWLAADPVTLRAGMTRLMLVASGMSQLPIADRAGIARAVSELLAEEGLALETRHPEHWYLPLDKPLGFDFIPPYDALGADLAEVLPEHAEAAQWRRLLNLVQMMLHSLPANEKLESAGYPPVNSLWFWGGGILPQPAADNTVSAVISDDAISKGLALLSGLTPGSTSQLTSTDGNWLDQMVTTRQGDTAVMLIDWALQGADVDGELQRLDGFIAQLLPLLAQRRIDLEIATPNSVWKLPVSSLAGFRLAGLKRFWQRDRSLVQLLLGEQSG
jgi:hypothetical protein